MPEPFLIAEVKTKSPFGYESEKTWEELFKIADSAGDMLSIHTNPYWGGSFEDITRAKEGSDKEVLAKGIHGSDESVERALDAGADHVLVVGRVPPFPLRLFCWIEPLNLGQIEELGLVYADVVVWNSRDIRTGYVKRESFNEARQRFDGHLIQAGNIHTPRDIHPDANMVIVGEHLEEFVAEW